MNATAPVPPTPPATQEDAAPQGPRWRRWLEYQWSRTALGLVVLAAIVGGLVAFDRLSGGDGDLGPLDGQSPEVGEQAPLFALRDPAGNVVKLSDYRGRVVWINFWATWCGPCRRELPDIQRLADEFGDEELVVLAVNFEEPGDRALEFWDELGLDLPILLDSDGDVAERYLRVSLLRGFPDNFFIDSDGVLRAFQLGFLTEEQMREKLAEAGLE